MSPTRRTPPTGRTRLAQCGTDWKAGDNPIRRVIRARGRRTGRSESMAPFNYCRRTPVQETEGGWSVQVWERAVLGWLAAAARRVVLIALSAALFAGALIGLGFVLFHIVRLIF